MLPNLFLKRLVLKRAPSRLRSLPMTPILCQWCSPSPCMRICAGPFASLIFADSICSLAMAAPLAYFTKPWRFANWRLVVTLLFFQVRSHFPQRDANGMGI